METTDDSVNNSTECVTDEEKHGPDNNHLAAEDEVGEGGHKHRRQPMCMCQVKFSNPTN